MDGVDGSTNAVEGSKWRFFVCGRDGTRLSMLSSRAKDRKIEARRMRPDCFKFRIPSADDQVAQVLGDGYPLIAKQIRTIKGYRQELNGASKVYRLRLGVIIWITEDKGDADGVAWTGVTGYSPYILLPKLPITGPAGTTKDFVFDDLHPGEIIVESINNAQEAAGF